MTRESHRYDPFDDDALYDPRLAVSRDSQTAPCIDVVPTAETRKSTPLFAATAEDHIFQQMMKQAFGAGEPDDLG